MDAIRLSFPCFLEKIDTVSAQLFDEEGRTVGSHPLSYDAERQEFFLLMEAGDRLIHYQLKINDRFLINNINCPHVLLGDRLVTQLSPEPVYYETGMTCLGTDTFGYVAEGKRRSKKSFVFLHEKVHCEFVFNHASNVMYMLEIIDPAGELFDLREYVIVPGESLVHDIIIPWDHEVYGIWRINVYTSGQVVAGEHFCLIPANRYNSTYEEPANRINVQC